MHEHHRDRLREKAVKDVSLLNDYEILELILFGVVPRRNTNDTAHRLIDEFGSLEAVFAAKPEMLMCIEGVGKTVAAHIAAINSVLSAVVEREDAFPKTFTFTDVRQPLIKFFRNMKEEALLVFYLDKNQKIISRHSIYGHKSYEVDIDLNEFSRMILINKPAYIVVVHNHLSGNVSPSGEDDSATQKFAAAALLNGASLIDHIIVSKDKIYSYYYDRRLDAIVEKARKAISD